MRFLVIDDSPTDRELAIRRLRKEPELNSFEFVEIGRLHEFEEIIEQGGFDFVLTDYQLHWTDGLQIFTTIHQRYPDVPIVMFTGTGSEEVAVEGLRAGLNNYVLKKHLDRLPLAIHDVLEKRRLRVQYEETLQQLQQAQKLESIGLLVSGIAHDFNNMLGGILGYAERGMAKAASNQSIYDNFVRIQDIATRATHMTQQLLAFSRRQVLKPTSLDLNMVIRNLLELLGKVIAGQVEIQFVPDPNLKTVHADHAQMEQVLLNLCINARDAMPNGGTLVIKTRMVPPGACPGEKKSSQYVLLSVQDTGVGMDEQTRAKIFEPFFTTKDVGKGTGLGLSMLHGIIGQHDGCINVESQPGKGTTFKVYLPAFDDEPLALPTSRSLYDKSRQNSHGLANAPAHGTILVVEDDPDLRFLMQEALEDYGYTVRTACDGVEGLALFKQFGGEIALIVSDLITPKMAGRELYERIHKISSETRFLFVSGYQANQISQNFVLTKGFEFLPKPFDLDELAAKVQAMLA